MADMRCNLNPRCAAVAACLAVLLAACCRAMPTIDGSAGPLENLDVSPHAACNPLVAENPAGHCTTGPMDYERTAYPIVVESSKGGSNEVGRVGSATRYTEALESEKTHEYAAATILHRLMADHVMSRRAPCRLQRFPLVDFETVKVIMCNVALGPWGPDAVDMSQLATDDANGIHTIGLSLEGVEVIRGAMFDANDKLLDGEMSLGGASDRAWTASAVRWVARELADLSAATKALWVRLPMAPFRHDDCLLGDGELELAVAAALKQKSISVLSLEVNPRNLLGELFPHTWGRICTALASTRGLRTLEVVHPTWQGATRLRSWPFEGVFGHLQRHLAAHTDSAQWLNVRRLTFMYPGRAQLLAKHLLNPYYWQRFFGNWLLVRELWLFFNFIDLRDAVDAFLPLVSGYFDNAMGLDQLLVHTVAHLTFLTMAVVDERPAEFITDGEQDDQVKYPVAVVHYLAALGRTTAAQRSAMLKHLGVVLPRVRAATVRLPRQLCEPSAECHATHLQAAQQLRMVLSSSPQLVRLKLDFNRNSMWEKRWYCAFGSVPWYARALADAGPTELRVLELHTHVSDAERGEHLVRILQNNPHLDTLKLVLHDSVVFGSKYSAAAGPICVVPDTVHKQIPSVLETCLYARYAPLMGALQTSRIQRFFVRARLTYNAPGKNATKLILHRRHTAARVMAQELSGILSRSAHAELVPKLFGSGLYWHPRLSEKFAIESSIDRLFPALSMVPADPGSLAHVHPAAVSL